MKILHTADVHLHTDHPRRLQTLETIIELGRQQDIDVLLIAGDLFDDHSQAQALRGDIRRLFSNLPYKVLAIPGNHDERVYAEETYYGDQFTPLTTQPFAVEDGPDWRMVAVPYSNSSLAELAEDLRSQLDSQKTNILVLHCTFALPQFSNEDYGGEDYRYMPVTQGTLAELGYDYVLAGHFHTSYRQRKLTEDSLFIYPGSPISISTREQGPRSVNIVDDQGCRPYTLSTWYYQTLSYRLNTANTGAILAQIQQDIQAHDDNLCTLTIETQGYIREDEGEFQRQLNALVNGRQNTEIANQVFTVQKVLADPLYQRFHKLLDLDTPQGQSMEIMLLDAFTQLQTEEG